MASNYNGWIKLNRRLLNNDLWNDDKFSKGQAWVDLLLLAQASDKGGYKAGRVYKSQMTLANRWSWGRKSVADFLDNLVELNMITVDCSNGGTVINIVNWESYQNDYYKKQEPKEPKEPKEPQNEQEYDPRNDPNMKLTYRRNEDGVKVREYVPK